MIISIIKSGKPDTPVVSLLFKDRLTHKLLLSSSLLFSSFLRSLVLCQKFWNFKNRLMLLGSDETLRLDLLFVPGLINIRSHGPALLLLQMLDVRLLVCQIAPSLPWKSGNPRARLLSVVVSFGGLLLYAVKQLWVHLYLLQDVLSLHWESVWYMLVSG